MPAATTARRAPPKAGSARTPGSRPHGAACNAAGGTTTTRSGSLAARSPSSADCARAPTLGEVARTPVCRTPQREAGELALPQGDSRRPDLVAGDSTVGDEHGIQHAADVDEGDERIRPDRLDEAGDVDAGGRPRGARQLPRPAPDGGLIAAAVVHRPGHCSTICGRVGQPRAGLARPGQGRGQLAVRCGGVPAVAARAVARQRSDHHSRYVVVRDCAAARGRARPARVPGRSQGHAARCRRRRSDTRPRRPDLGGRRAAAHVGRRGAAQRRAVARQPSLGSTPIRYAARSPRSRSSRSAVRGCTSCRASRPAKQVRERRPRVRLSSAQAEQRGATAGPSSRDVSRPLAASACSSDELRTRQPSVTLVLGKGSAGLIRQLDSARSGSPTARAAEAATIRNSALEWRDVGLHQRPTVAASSASGAEASGEQNPAVASRPGGQARGRFREAALRRIDQGEGPGQIASVEA